MATGMFVYSTIILAYCVLQVFQRFHVPSIQEAADFRFRYFIEQVDGFTTVGWEMIGGKEAGGRIWMVIDFVPVSLKTKWHDISMTLQFVMHTNKKTFIFLDMVLEYFCISRCYPSIPKISWSEHLYLFPRISTSSD